MLYATLSFSGFIFLIKILLFILVDVTAGPDVVIRVNNDNLVSDLSEADPPGFSGKMIRMF